MDKYRTVMLGINIHLQNDWQWMERKYHCTNFSFLSPTKFFLIKGIYQKSSAENNTESSTYH